MGIFANKKYDTKTGEYLGQIKSYQKLAEKNDISLPSNPTEQPKRSLLAKAGSFLSAFETAPAVEAALKGENPFTAYVSSVKKGLSTKEDITIKKSYSDILESVGWKSAEGTGSLKESATWKNWGKELVGLAGDIVLDPTTYLTFGAGSAAKSGAKETAKSGINFAGKTLIKTETLQKPFQKIASLIPKSDTTEALAKGLFGIKDTIGKAFYRDYGLPEKYVTEKQKFLDLYHSDGDDIVDTLTKVFKDTSEKDRKAISYAIEKNDFKGLSEYNQKIAQDTKNIFENIAKTESDRGLLDNTLNDYVTHIYKDRKKAEQYIKILRGGVQGGETKFAKERVIPTIEEAKKLGLDPEEDVAKILAARMMASQKAIREQDLLKSVGNKFGQAKELLKPEDALNKNLVEYTNKEFKGLVIPKSIADDLANISKKTINDEALNVFLRGYDAIQNFFKGSVTSIFPAFHGRNFLSNVAQNALDIGVQAINPIKNLKAINILRGGKGELTTKTGKYTYDELRKLMKEKGILGSPGYRDVGETIGQKLGIGLKTPTIKQIGRQFTSDNVAFRAGRKVGTGIENHARAINFITNIERGLSPDEAARRTKQFLFDYDNLSDFEKTVLKRAIPFYTWTRKNIELQGRTLLTKPGVIGAELKAQRLSPSQETQEERQNLPEYIAESLAIKLGVNKGLTQYLTQMGLPIENFFQNLPQGISRKEMTDYLNKVASQSAFIPKYLTELATAHEFFRNKPLKEIMDAKDYANAPQFLKNWLEYKKVPVDYTNKKGERIKYDKYVANPYKLHLLRSLPTSRGVSTVAPFTELMGGDENPYSNISTLGKLIKATTGLKIYDVDPEKMQEQELKNYIKEVEDVLTNYGVTAQFEKTYITDSTKEQRSNEAKSLLSDILNQQK